MSNYSSILQKNKTYIKIHPPNTIFLKLTLDKNIHKDNINNDIYNINILPKFKIKKTDNERKLFKNKLNIKSFTNESSLKLIKKVKDFRNKFFNETFPSKLNLSGENNFSLSLVGNNRLNFDINLNDYFHNYPIKDSITQFKEKNRIKRRFNYINNFCKNLFKNYKKDDYFTKFESKIKKYYLKYQNTRNNFNNYLTFLRNKKFEEENVCNDLRIEKKNLMENIKELTKKIIKYQDLINDCINIKKFLLKIKGNALKIKENKKEIKIKPNIKSSDHIQKLTTNNIKTSGISNNLNILDDNISNLYLTPLKTNNNINHAFSLSKEKVKNRLKNKIKYNLKKINFNVMSKPIANQEKNICKYNEKNFPIFSKPEEFMELIDDKVIKIRKSLGYYNKILYTINNYKSPNTRGNILIDKQIEKRYNLTLNKLKNENKILNEELESLNQTQKFECLNKISDKIIIILLNINKYMNLEDKFNIIDFEAKIKSFDDFDQINEKTKTKNIFLLGLLEKIIDILKEEDKKYKEQSKYKIIKGNIENKKFEEIRKKIVENLKTKIIKNNIKILENHNKSRFFPINKNGIIFKNYKKKYSINAINSLYSTII